MTAQHNLGAVFHECLPYVGRFGSLPDGFLSSQGLRQALPRFLSLALT